MSVLAAAIISPHTFGDEAPGGPFTAANDYAQARTVKIYGAGIGRVSGFATGLIVSADGLIMTTQGVHLAGYRVRVTLPDGQTKDAEVVRRSQPLQLALLKIDAETPDYFEISDKPVARRGDWVLGVSNAFKVADGPEPLSVNLGIISLRTSLDATRGTQDFDYTGEVLLIDAITSNPGAGGGAVVTAESRLAGMIGKEIESKSTNTRLNYAVPADVLKLFLDNKEVEATPVVQEKAVVGIRLFALGGKKGPAYIDRVVRGSPADHADLKPDDLVLSVNGQSVRSIEDYEEVVATLKPNVEITLTLKRRNDVLQVQLTPTAEKQDD